MAVNVLMFHLDVFSTEGDEGRIRMWGLNLFIKVKLSVYNV